MLPHLTIWQALAHLAAMRASLQYLGDLGVTYVVYKNDEKTVDEIRAMNPAGILVSPGPGTSPLPHNPSSLKQCFC